FVACAGHKGDSSENVQAQRAPEAQTAGRQTCNVWNSRSNQSGALETHQEPGVRGECFICINDPMGALLAPLQGARD
ncbi:MAG: hypothetical protein NZ823_15100, partial [Blastocatellia bacterium]|nr:hypothetical protein [Blastocatellia bacterium]